MKFQVEGRQINCIRIEKDRKTGESEERVVATFDAHLDFAAPHVAAMLTRNELEQLNLWLQDRKKIQSKSKQQTLLESLPKILQEATKALDTTPVLNEETLKELIMRMHAFAEALDDKLTTTSKRPEELKEMEPSDVLKEQLNVIKKDL